MDLASPTMSGESLWPRVAGLPLVIEGCEYDRLHALLAYLEDPHDLPEIAQRLGDHLARVSYDAPIRSADDIGATPLAGRAVNVKPSRNDVAPSAYNEDDPPGGLPASPLAPRPDAAGFRWAA